MAHPVPPVRRDPLIIGAGPAGSAAAITLARNGRRPIVLEKATGPTDKVCGDFLSIDTIQRAQDLGIDPIALGATPIERIRVIHGTRVAEAALPFPALGLSRRCLDAALLRQATQAGADIRSGQTVRRLTCNGGAWQVQTDTALTAETIFLATGKHDLRDSPRAHTRHDAIGMKMYLSLASTPAKTLAGATELTLFPGGYAGMQHVECGKVVLCIAVQRPALRTYGGGWHDLLNAIQARSPRFRSMLAGAIDLLPRPLAVAAIPYGYQTTPGELFRLGDQAAVIPSLTGDGMAIALHSGQQAAEAWLDGVSPEAFQQVTNNMLAPQMRLASLLHNGGLSAATQAIAMPILQLYPGLLRQAARLTRIPAGTNPRT